MKLIRRIASCLLVLCMLLPLASCGGATSQTAAISLTDQAGRTVTLVNKAERVVSCYYVTTYAMLALGLGDKLVGIEKKAESRPIYRMVRPELLELPVVGSLKEINIEKIASLSPDLVILPKKLTDSAAALEALQIPTLIVDPETDADLRGMLTLLAKACGVEKKAEALLAYYDKKLGEFEAPQEKPSILLLGNSSFLTAAPSGMYQNDWIISAGGTNALGAVEGNYWQEISYETVLQCDPDYIVIPAGASYTADDLRADSILSTLRAVQNGHILCVPNVFEEWDSPIPSGVLGVLWLRSVLHPSIYSTSSFRKDIVDFYETFYGFTPSEDALASACQ